MLFLLISFVVITIGYYAWKEYNSPGSVKPVNPKENLEAGEQNNYDGRLIIKRNGAFEYIEKKYGIDCNIYRNLSVVIHNHSVAASNKFAQVIGGKSNEDLIHFFYDYFLCLYVATKPHNFHNDIKDVYSALVDGIHIEYYGNVSDQEIETILDIWTTKDKCFLKTDIALFKKRDDGDRLRFLIVLASYCADIEVGANEGIKHAMSFIEIEKANLSSIDTFIDIQEQLALLAERPLNLT
jgi:hypothetical protein